MVNTPRAVSLNYPVPGRELGIPLKESIAVPAGVGEGHILDSVAIAGVLHQGLGPSSVQQPEVHRLRQDPLFRRNDPWILAGNTGGRPGVNIGLTGIEDLEHVSVLSGSPGRDGGGEEELHLGEVGDDELLARGRPEDAPYP